MKKKMNIIVSGLLLLGAVALTGCGVRKPTTADSMAADSSKTETTMETTMASYQKISAEDAKKRIDSGDSLIILDVRNADEYEEKHIPGAILIPNDDIGTEPLDALPDLNQEILVYCRSGNRSAQAAKKLIEAGYTKVYDFGGIGDWTYETESGAYESMAMEATASEGLLGTFHTADINGEPVTQDVFAQSNLTMLNIWGTFCYPCIQEMPDIGQLSEEYKDRMQIIGLISDVTQPEDKGALEIIEYTGANYLHIVNSVDLMNGYVGQVQLVPTTVFLDKEGKQVGSVYTGSQSKSSWERIIKEMLEKVE